MSLEHNTVNTFGTVDSANQITQETQLLLRDRVSAAHYTELSAVGQYKMHRLEIFNIEKYHDLETWVRSHWNDTI